MCTVTASRSPPNACPTVTTPASDAAQRVQRPGERRPAAPRRRSSRRRPSGRGRWPASPISTAGSAECRSATTTGMPPRSSASAISAWCSVSCSSTPCTVTCSGVYRAFTRCPGPVGSGGSRSGTATTSAYPAGAQALRQRGRVQQHVVADLRDADERGVGQRLQLRRRSGTSTVSSRRRATRRPVAVTRPAPPADARGGDGRRSTACRQASQRPGGDGRQPAAAPD